MQKTHLDDGSDLGNFITDRDDNDDCPCIHFYDLFSHSKPDECWLQCTMCSRWVNASSAGVPKKIQIFVCYL